MKEPILWFAVIGILLFSLDQCGKNDPVIVDDSVRNQIANLWETQMGAPPDEAELASLVNHWVREEIFYREALRLGLDREDTIVRRRLVQKLEFLAQEVDESAITPAEVSNFYAANLADYTLPKRYSLSQIYIAEAGKSADIKIQLEAGADWQTLGQSSLLPRRMIRKSAREITSTFGVEFTDNIVDLSPEKWHGPVSSTFGFHFVRLDAVVSSEVTPLAHVERQVLSDMLHQKREESLERYYQDLMHQHEVEYQ